MKIFHDIKSIRAELKKHQNIAPNIGLVPTMGAIHDGHLSLVKQIKQQCSTTVATIFVNQKQFNNPEDYQNYPNTLAVDIEKLKNSGVDILFNPSADEIYNPNFATTVGVNKLTDQLCGKTRPGHFDGVALIITKLFNIIKPATAIFGEKDFQQLQIIKKLTSDLNFDTKIISGKIIREDDGLAMSSRNLRLSKKAREIAPQIYQTLLKIRKQISHSNLEAILLSASQELSKAGFGVIDYLQICDEENLQPINFFNNQIKSRIFIAIYLDKIRLIDNLKI